MASLVDSPHHAFATHSASQAGLLIDAEDYYRAFYEAARQAKRSILLSGWQFDRRVALLRGEEAERADHPVTLLKFLNSLCEQKPELEIRILAWDFHLILAAEREWMQRIVFNWMTNPRLLFRFDDNHVERGCHHQKFAIIDAQLCFMGGLDLCDHRWDSRQHKASDPLRKSRGEPHQPFHDIQAFVEGPDVARSMIELFRCRWERAGGEPLPKDLEQIYAPLQFEPKDALLLPAKRVALSRTDPHASPRGPKPCVEIRELYKSAILSAEQLIYLETQYFSSHAIAEAFEARMRDASRPKLDIVMVLNKRGETLKEQAAVGLAQAQIITRLREVARETGHRLGLYVTYPACEEGEKAEKCTFIHAKLMIVDDRFLTVGSANLTNRSMAVDTELNLSVEAESQDDLLTQAIREVRATLLGEHTGGPAITTSAGLVRELDALAMRAEEGSHEAPCRLHRHPSPTSEESTALKLIDPQELPFDPDEEDLRGDQEDD